MKKFILITLLATMFICVFAFNTSAAELTKYCDVKLTLTTDETVTAYFKIAEWGGKPSISRDTIYKTLNTDDGTYDWADVKVLDFRDFHYTEGYAPMYMNGTACNEKATNVTTIYFPSTLYSILNTSFTSSWKSLNTVYIPKSLEIIDYNAFTSSAIENLVIEEDSNLKSIGRDAFRNCKNLTSFDFEKTQKLETIGYCAFYTSNLSGKVVIPNSVTYIDDGAFRSTLVETFVLGDGETYLGYNLVGNDGGTSKTALKEVYISAKSTFNQGKLSEIWFNNGSTINFYVIGTNEEVAQFIPKLKNTGRVKFATEDEIQNGTAVSGYNAIIITDYNICDAFYNSNHTLRENCDFIYENPITEFYEETSCTVCNMRQRVGETYQPVLKFLGYSVKNDGSALCVGYDVNQDSYAVLTEKFGKTLNYGILVALGTENNDSLEIKGGEVSIKDGFNVTAISIGTEYSSFELKLTGFSEATLNKEIVMCAYAYDGDSIKYLYDTAQVTPYTVTYNQILLG